MDIGMIGLGRMGGNMTRRLLKAGHRVVGYNRSYELTDELAREGQGFVPTRSIEELVAALQPPRVAWAMVPAGQPTETTVSMLLDLFDSGDIVIDGGNSNYKDSQRRAKSAQESGIHFVDVGTSGGIWGLKQGYSMMVGGERTAVERLRPIFEALAPGVDRGWGYVGPSGSGHFVKMVHNGIEYGMMQAYAEGFEILKAKQEFDLDLYEVAEIWRFGSVIRSWLLDLSAQGLAEDQELSAIRGWVADSGEGRWTVFEAIDQDVPAPVITLSLLMRFASRQDESYAAKVLAMMRNQFGGHAIKHEGDS